MAINDKEILNILVAGAAGFVPGHLCEYYLKKGHQVFGVDNFITGTTKNIDYLKKNYSNFKFFNQDIVKEVPRPSGVNFDLIFSLASPASPIDFMKIPLEILEVNSVGTKNLLELALEHKARFLEASTSEVYGDPLVHPQREDYFGNVNPIGIRSCYDESKRFAEALTMSYHRKYGVDTRIVRIFNTYGPRMRPDDGRVIPNFINQALDKKPLTIYGDGLQTRSFCFVDDLVEAISLVAHSSEIFPINIGNPDEYTILETANIINEILDNQGNIEFKELPKDDPKKRRPDISKLKNLTDFSPKVSFSKGLEKTINYFKENR